MAQTIALAGKGGVGKTTICGMLIEYLCEKKNGAVLAVDADANSNLNEVLGVEVEDTLGDIREDMTRAEMASEQVIPTGMTKADYAEMRFSDALTEADDFDLLVMGRTQGKGCYCFVNGLLTAQVSKYAKNYRYIVVDNEAGLEHLSRGVLPQVDTIHSAGERLLPAGRPGRRPAQRDDRGAEAGREGGGAHHQPGPRRPAQPRHPGGDRQVRHEAHGRGAPRRHGLRVRRRGQALRHRAPGQPGQAGGAPDL